MKEKMKRTVILKCGENSRENVNRVMLWREFSIHYPMPLGLCTRLLVQLPMVAASFKSFFFIIFGEKENTLCNVNNQ
jgi:hypothetical protein